MPLNKLYSLYTLHEKVLEKFKNQFWLVEKKYGKHLYTFAPKVTNCIDKKKQVVTFCANVKVNDMIANGYVRMSESVYVNVTFCVIKFYTAVLMLCHASINGCGGSAYIQSVPAFKFCVQCVLRIYFSERNFKRCYAYF